MMTPEQEKAWDRVFGYCTDTREKSDDYPTSGLDVDEKEAILAIDKERTSLRAEVAAKESSLCAAREALDDQAAACCGSEDNPCGWCKASRASLAGGKCRHLEELEGIAKRIAKYHIKLDSTDSKQTLCIGIRVEDFDELRRKAKEG